MNDNTFTIKEASKMLDCTTQNIYQQKAKLIQLGYMEQSNTGAYILNEKGINYLREKRAETIKANSQEFNQVGSKGFTNIANPTITTDNVDLVSVLKEQLQELKEEKEYWRNEYTKKDTELQAKNEYIQGLNTQVFALLGTQEQNKQQEQDVKKGFWKRLFDKQKQQ